MTTMISHASLIRGADGRLFAITTQGVVEIPESAAGGPPAIMRAGDRGTFDVADHAASRSFITPGA